MKRFAMLDADGRATAFYHEDVHGPRDRADSIIPTEATEITQEQWLALAASPQTRLIKSTIKIVAAATPPPTRAQIVRMRDAALASCVWTIFPEAPLTEKQRLEWSAYREQLFKLTEQDPTLVTMPIPPL